MPAATGPTGVAFDHWLVSCEELSKKPEKEQFLDHFAALLLSGWLQMTLKSLDNRNMLRVTKISRLFGWMKVATREPFREAEKQINMQHSRHICYTSLNESPTKMNNETHWELFLGEIANHPRELLSRFHFNVWNLYSTKYSIIN